MAKNRAEVWRKYLLGDYETILQQRKMYHNIVIHHPYEIDAEISRQIKADIPRTTLHQGHISLSDNKQKIIEIETGKKPILFSNINRILISPEV